MINDIDRLQKRLRLRVAAHACHEHAAACIIQSLQDGPLSHARLHFYAFFCDIPALRLGTRITRRPTLLAPFIDREIYKRSLGLKLRDDAEPENPQDCVDAALTAIKAWKPGRPLDLQLAFTDAGATYQAWLRFLDLGTVAAGKLGRNIYNRWRLSEEGYRGGHILEKPLRASGCISDIRHKLKMKQLTAAEKTSYINLFGLLYYYLMTSANVDDCLFFIGAPLCTYLTFYGLLIAAVEAPSGYRKLATDEPGVCKALRQVEAALVDQAQQTYLPTMVLFQNSWEEHVLGEVLDRAGQVPYRANEEGDNRLEMSGDVRRFKQYKDRVYSRLGGRKAAPEIPPKVLASDDNLQLELALERVWRRRWGEQRGLGSESVRKSLYFGDKIVASPGMIKAVRDIASLALETPPKPPLLAVLIVGPAGSGKETMLNLVRLFSPKFWNTPCCILNMGTVHPQDIGEVLTSHALDILGKDCGTLVLDELNSLDISAQPVLLRLLEQGELQLLGDENVTVQSGLVIGLVNEPPERLTLESIRESVTDQPLFGELLGSYLYEQWKGMSRLRDDLYYRIRRCGEISIKGLNERRADIPVAFYFMLRQYVRVNKLAQDVFPTYPALMTLTDPSLNWRGNMRKLEAVTRQVGASLAREASRDDIAVVDSIHIERAFLELGMCSRDAVDNGC